MSLFSRQDTHLFLRRNRRSRHLDHFCSSYRVLICGRRSTINFQILSSFLTLSRVLTLHLCQFFPSFLLNLMGPHSPPYFLSHGSKCPDVETAVMQSRAQTYGGIVDKSERDLFPWRFTNSEKNRDKFGQGKRS